MLRLLKCLMLFLLFLLIFLFGMFFQMADCEATTEAKTLKIIPTELDVIDQIALGYDRIKKQSTCPENKKDGLYIFVSLSMPKTLLEQYEQIAKQIGAKLVIRGFKNNSFKETIEYTKEVVCQVDPVAFKKFGITSVPSFVLSDNDKFDKLVGNVSIKYALEQFEAKGDLKQKAKEYLMRLK
jgi:type-F conjugative transfer system pilin assembly protein TrbC